MTYSINTLEHPELNFGAKGVERILQNVRNLISTYLYEVAYNRTMGINAALFDKPSDIAASMYTAEIYRVIGDYEQRATVKSVAYKGVDTDGNMGFEVVIEI